MVGTGTQTARTCTDGTWTDYGNCLATSSSCYENQGYYLDSNQSCSLMKSCKALKSSNSNKDSRLYVLNIKNDDSSLTEVYCDMLSDGGIGYTGIKLEEAWGQLNGDWQAVVKDQNGMLKEPTQRTASELHLRTQDSRGKHYYTFEFDVPFGYTKFFLGHDNVGNDKQHTFKIGGYSGRVKVDDKYTNHDSEIQPSYFIHSGSWSNKAYECTEGSPDSKDVGDISFGSEEGPVESFARMLRGINEKRFSAYHEDLKWQHYHQDTEYDVVFTSTKSKFKIGWGECGSQEEGWEIWTSGRIFFH